MYCDESTMKERISRKVCIIDFAYGSRAFHLEVKVQPNSTLTQILESSDAPQLKGWQGDMEPSITIINTRSVLAYTGSPEFLQTKIEAGDFIVVQPVH
jgi:hypothetical protein